MDLPPGSVRGSAPHVVLVGAGGVGCWLYASLREAARRNPALARVSLVARGAALDRVRGHGIQYEVRGEAGEGVPPSIVVDNASVRAEPTCAALREQGDLADYVILCVKTWQVPSCVHAPTCTGYD
jgi:ketopantoate reductase